MISPSSTLSDVLTLRNHLAEAIELKKNNYRYSLPATYSLLSLAISTLDELDTGARAPIKERRKGQK